MIKSDPSTWKDPRHKKGWEGEELARRFLQRRGWRILDRRFRMGRLEIDLVARRGAVVAFIEVKTRFSDAFGSPLEAVTAAKQREISRVAGAWIHFENFRTARVADDQGLSIGSCYDAVGKNTN